MGRISNLLKKKKPQQNHTVNNNVPEAVNLQPAGNEAMAAELQNNLAERGIAAGEKELAEDENTQVQTPEKLSELAKALRESKKRGGGKNSSRFESVESSLRKVIDILNVSLNQDDVKENQNNFLKALKVYAELNQACEDYLARRSFSQNRRKIVAQILEHVKQDINSLRAYYDNFMLMSESEYPNTISDVIREGRQRKLVLAEGKKEKDLKHVGGAVSDLIVLQKGDLADKEISGYFKKEEDYTVMTGKEAAKKIYKELLEKMPLDKQDRKAIQKQLEKAAEEEKNAKVIAESIIDGYPKYWENQKVHEFLDIFNQKCSAYDTTRSNLIGAAGVNVKQGDTVNISRRNVAASRLANLLGLGNLLAQSETAEFQGDSGSKKGNLMQAAKGTIASQSIKDSYQKAVEQGKVKSTNSERIDTGEMRQLMSPQFMKELNSLQVLDNLMGQIDRHFNNFMVDFNDVGQLNRVQGIDNDMAFGYEMCFRGGMHDRSVLDKDEYNEENWQNARLAIPYMDRALAERILQIKTDDIRILMVDVLEPAAIEGLCKRLEVLQKAIEAEKNDKNSKRFLDSNEEWGSEAVYDVYAQDSKSGVWANTYLGRFMGSQNYKVNAVREQKKLVSACWERARAEQQLESPEQIEAFLLSIGVEEKAVSYLKRTGQLSKEPEFLDKFGEQFGINTGLRRMEIEYRKAQEQN